MTDDRPSKLPDAMHDRLTDTPVPTSRREFIAKASALGVALPAVAIAGCSAPGQAGADSAQAGAVSGQ